MLTGNKGEWSEAYVFLKLLADGKLDAADENLNAIPNVYYPIIKIIRNDKNFTRNYVINGNIDIVDGITGITLLSIPILEFIEKSKELFLNLKNGKARSFNFPKIEQFLNSIDINTLKLSTAKSDIKIVIHDFNIGMEQTLGFSIKSMIGKDATLFNAGAGTNFIFKLLKPKGLIFDLKDFNIKTLFKSKSGVKSSKISIRLNELEMLGFEISFFKISSENLFLNLMLIDSQLPEIISQLVLKKYKSGISSTKDLLRELNQTNPLGYDMSKKHPFYEVKVKNFLTESALGMTPEKVWTSIYDVTGGIIIVKQTGDLVLYHIYNRKEFQDYLLNYTKLEQASTSEDESNPGNPIPSKAKPFKFGWVYEENGELFIKLNLQIRFK